MATWDDVRQIVADLPQTEEIDRGTASWKVKGKLLVWERPLRKADLAALGEAAPTGAILGVRVADEGVKHALIADEPDVFFTTPHFDGYPAVLARLDELGTDELRELIVEAWLLQAPKRVAKDFLDSRPGTDAEAGV